MQSKYLVLFSSTVKIIPAMRDEESAQAGIIVRVLSRCRFFNSLVFNLAANCLFSQSTAGYNGQIAVETKINDATVCVCVCGK